MSDDLLTDAQKLRLLADWFDTKYPNDPNTQVQTDLRRIAANIERNKNGEAGHSTNN